MDESFGAGGFDQSNFGGGNVQAEARPEGIVPLFIKQIHNMQDTNISLYGMTFGMATIVGIVRNVEHSSTKITYTMEDSTGRIEAHLWLEEGDNVNQPNIITNTYARVFGALRAQGGGKTIMLFKIVPVETANEVTTHMLEVLMTRYKAEDLTNNGVRAPADAGNVFSDSTNNNEHSNGLQGKEKMIFDAVKAFKGDTGISIKELQGKFGSISGSEISSITEFLSSEGHIYTSIDSDHFLPTDA